MIERIVAAQPARNYQFSSRYPAPLIRISPSFQSALAIYKPVEWSGALLARRTEEGMEPDNLSVLAQRAASEW